MITQYFDINQRQVIQAPGTVAPASLQPWVYGDNYNLAIYLVGNGQFQTIAVNDSLQLMLFQPAATLPEQNLAIVSTPVTKTDPAGFTYYQVNVNLKTTPLANLVQSVNQSAKCEFHYIFTPASGERFSSSADLPVTVNPDPSEAATGATPIPPGYPTNPNVFEQIANKGIASGYAGLDSGAKVPLANLPALAGSGDMQSSVYDPTKSGTVLTAATANQVPWLGITNAPTQFAPTLHASSHNGGGDPIPLAASSGPGLCPTLDGTTITVSASKLSAILASLTAPGIVQPDGATVTIAAGKITVPTATTSALGLVKPDGTTITVSSGVITAIAAGGGVGQHGCRIWKSASQAYSAGAALSFDTNTGTGLFDTDTYFAAGNPTRITIPSGQAGYYSVGAVIFWDTGQTGGTYRYLKIALNGNVNSVVTGQSAPIVPGQPFMNLGAIYKFVVGDYIEIYPNTDASSGQNFGSYGSVTNRYSPCFYLLRIS